jgi:hypothetical protein
MLAPPLRDIHPTDHEVTRIHPPHDLTSDAETVWRMKSFQIMIVHLETLNAAAASNPSMRETTLFPDFVWRSADEPDLFELRGPPSRIFKKGDEIDCYGMLEGIWKIVEKKRRSHRWDITSTTEPEEWAYILVRDETTGQETILKMAARYFHPTTLAIQVHKTIHKVKSALSLRSPSHHCPKKSHTHDGGH